MRIKCLIVVVLVMVTNIAFSQKNAQTANSVNSDEKAELKDTTDGVKISGYIQTEYQHFFIPKEIGGATPYFATFAGGNFVSRWSDNRFMTRRGRLKISHHTSYTEGVFSMDATRTWFCSKRYVRERNRTDFGCIKRYCRDTKSSVWI